MIGQKLNPHHDLRESEIKILILIPPGGFMQIKKQTKEISILTVLFLLFVFALVQRFERESEAYKNANHPLETFFAR